MFRLRADFASYWGIRGPVSEHLMSFDWGQNLGRCFGGILNVSARAWICVFWSMPETYLLASLPDLLTAGFQLKDIASYHRNLGEIFSTQIWFGCANRVTHADTTRAGGLFIWIRLVLQERQYSIGLVVFTPIKSRRALSKAWAHGQNHCCYLLNIWWCILMHGQIHLTLLWRGWVDSK